MQKFHWNLLSRMKKGHIKMFFLNTCIMKMTIFLLYFLFKDQKNANIYLYF